MLIGSFLDESSRLHLLFFHRLLLSFHLLFFRRLLLSFHLLRLSPSSSASTSFSSSASSSSPSASYSYSSSPSSFSSSVPSSSSSAAFYSYFSCDFSQSVIHIHHDCDLLMFELHLLSYKFTLQLISLILSCCSIPSCDISSPPSFAHFPTFLLPSVFFISTPVSLRFPQCIHMSSSYSPFFPSLPSYRRRLSARSLFLSFSISISRSASTD